MSDYQCCIDCVHCHKTKELVDKKWIETYTCTLWLDIGEKEEPLLLTLGSENSVKSGLCECFQEEKNG